MSSEKASTAIADDDGSALEFEALVGPQEGYVYSVALTITRDPSEAEDVLQETMLSAWRSWSKLRDRARVRAWLARICVNRCLQRRRRRVPRVVGGVPDYRTPAPGDPFALTGELIDFDRVFSQLSVRQRAVVALHLYHGYTVDECSELMGCRPGTARSHLARGMAHLKKELSR